MYIMSCSEVMYQAYYPYLYQRAGASAHPVPRTGPFSSPFGAAHQYDRFNVQRLPDAHSLSQAASSGGATGASSLDVAGHTHALYLQGSAHSSGGSVSSTGGGSPNSPLRPPHKEEDCSLHGRSSTEDVHGSVDDDDSQEGNSRAQYVSANCVVFTHYQGDAASVVDEHFSRALDKTAHAKESSPMTSRNFPPSFWNSQHYAGANAAAHAHSGTAADLYPEHYHHPSDAWYHQYSQHHYHHHNMAAAAQYSSLLLPGGRLHHAPCKPMDWQHPAIDSPYSSYTAMSGLEAQVQDSSKDLYWF